MSEWILERIGLNLKRQRLKKGWSQQRLADEAGVQRRYMPELESGRRNLSILTLEKLAAALQVTVKDFIGDDVPVPEKKKSQLQNEVKKKTARVLREGTPKQLHKLNVFIDEIL